MPAKRCVQASVVFVGWSELGLYARFAIQSECSNTPPKQ